MSIRAHGGGSCKSRLDPVWPVPAQLPGPLQAAIAAVRAMYDARHRSHPELLRRRRGRDSKRAGTTAQIAYVTRKRSDRTEAHCRLLVLLFSRCSLSTLEVGRWLTGDLEWLGLEELARATGLGAWRLSRAISDLRAAGYIYRHQGRDVSFAPDGTPCFGGQIAKLKLTLGAFEAFGCSPERLAVFRRAAAHGRRKQERKRERARPVPAIGQLISQAIDPAVADLRPGAPPVVADADAQAYALQCMKVLAENPTWDRDRVRWAAYQAIHGPPA